MTLDLLKVWQIFFLLSLFFQDLENLQEVVVTEAPNQSAVVI